MGGSTLKRLLFRLRLTPKGRLRRNVVILLLIPLVLLLVLRPCFTHQAALEQLQKTYHFGPVDAAQWYPEEQAYALRYDRWYAACPLQRGYFCLVPTWEPGYWGLTAAPVEDAPLSVCGLCYSDIIFGLCSDPAIEAVRLTYTDGENTHTVETSPGEGGLFLYHCPEALLEYSRYTAQGLDGQGQVLYTVTRSVIYENELI